MWIGRYGGGGRVLGKNGPGGAFSSNFKGPPN